MANKGAQWYGEGKFPAKCAICQKDIPKEEGRFFYLGYSACKMHSMGDIEDGISKLPEKANPKQGNAPLPQSVITDIGTIARETQNQRELMKDMAEALERISVSLDAIYRQGAK